MPTLKNKKTQKKKTTKRKPTKRKPTAKKLDKKEILKQKPFSEKMTVKKEIKPIVLFAPIIFFVLTLVTFGYTIFMPQGDMIEVMPSIGFVCFVLFIITFIYSMMKLNKC